MRKHWNLYLAGSGSIEAASEVLMRFVTTIRDLGLSVITVQVLEGAVHPDLNQLDTTEQGWTMYVEGEGDTSIAYGEIASLTANFDNAGLRIASSDFVEGEIRETEFAATH